MASLQNQLDPLSSFCTINRESSTKIQFLRRPCSPPRSLESHRNIHIPTQLAQTMHRMTRILRRRLFTAATLKMGCMQIPKFGGTIPKIYQLCHEQRKPFRNFIKNHSQLAEISCSQKVRINWTKSSPDHNVTFLLRRGNERTNEWMSIY